MKKNDARDYDDNLAICDTSTLIVAGALGSLGGAVTDSTGLGVASAIIIAATGLGLMRIDPVRRKTNATALALTKNDSEDASTRNGTHA